MFIENRCDLPRWTYRISCIIRCLIVNLTYICLFIGFAKTYWLVGNRAWSIFGRVGKLYIHLFIIKCLAPVFPFTHTNIHTYASNECVEIYYNKDRKYFISVLTINLSNSFSFIATSFKIFLLFVFDELEWNY